MDTDNLELQALTDQWNALPIDRGDSAACLLCYLIALRLSRIERLQELSAWPEGYVDEWGMPWACKAPVPEYVCSVQFLEFCQTLKGCGMGDDCRGFIERYLPRLVACWDDFAKLVRGKDAEETASILYLTVAGTVSPDTKFSELSAAGKAEEIYQQYQMDFQGWDLDLDTFQKIWKAVYYIPMPQLKVKTSKELTQTVKFFRTNMVSELALLRDFCVYEQNRTGLAGKANEWATYQYTIKHKPARAGVTLEEDAFDRIRLIYKEKAVDVVRAALYPYPALFAADAGIKVKDNYDRLFECSFLYQEFEKRMMQASDILVVNPGPDFLIRCNGFLKKHKRKSCTVAVQNEYVLAAYNSEFPQMKFCLLSDLNQKKGAFDLVGIISTCSNEALNVSEALSCCGLNGSIVALLPQSVLTKNDGLRPLLRSAMCVPEEIIAIASDATVTAPKKKMLLFANTFTGWESGDVPIFYTQCSKGARNLIIEKKHIYVSVEQLYQNRESLIGLRRRYEARQKDKGEKQSRDKANIYDFSEEIKLRYTIHQSKRDGSFIGTVHYRALSRGNSRERTPWDSEKATQEGLRHKDRQSVIDALEDTAYYEALDTCITSDLRHYYGEKIGECSLKTIWFCLRPVLIREKGYDDSLVRTVLFPAGNTALASIFPLKADDEIYRTAMGSVIPAGRKTTAKYWKQLNLILRTAVNQNWLQNNPIPRLMSEASKKDAKALRDMRNALTKKTFTPQEEQRIYAYLNEPIKIPFDRQKAKRCEAESIWLLGAIRLFSGMSLREACALTWADFVKLDGLDSYQLLVFKFLEDDGTCSYMRNQESSKYSYRKIPVAPILGRMLMDRLDFLRTVYGYAEKEIRKMPIILGREPTGAEAAEPSFCRYSEAVKSCRKLIEVAQIPTQELVFPGGEEVVMDMNKYGGDIFYTNFRHRANHVCAFSKGELSYVLGNKGPDTFSRHYCDYSNDMIQYMMAQKLRRWTWSYETETNAPPAVSRENRVRSVVRVSSRVGDVPYRCMDLVIRGDGSVPGSYANVEISSKYGTTGTVTVYPKEE